MYDMPVIPKFEPSGTPNGSFAFEESDGCQRVVNLALLKIVKVFKLDLFNLIYLEIIRANQGYF